MINKNPSETKSFIWSFTGIILWSVAVTVLSLCLTSKSTLDAWGVFFSYFSMPSVFVLNFIPVFLISVFFWCLFNSVWVSFLISSLLVVILSLVNYFKMMLRDAPLVISDFRLLSEALSISERYSFTVDGIIIFTVVFIAAGVIFAKKILNFKFAKYRFGALGAFAAGVLFILLSRGVYLNETVYEKTENIIRNSEYMNAVSKNDQFVSRGFVYSFIHSASEVFEIAPEGYSDKKAREILSDYEHDDIDEGKKINIIAIMLESYNDFSRFDTINFSSDPYEYFHKLQKKSVYGNVFTNIFGGGTIDSERSFVTGFLTQIEYSRPVNTYVSYLAEQGYTVEGGHPGHEWFYRRDIVNRFLGFENYAFFESDYEGIYNSNPNNGDGILEDKYFFEDIMKRYDKNKSTGKPYFNFSVTYQNHGPYASDGLTSGTEYVKKSPQMSDESYYIINNYLGGLKATGDALKALVEDIDSRDEPIMLVLFGDHNPWLGNESSVYRELGINLDFSDDNGLYNYFETPYIIYTNDSAKSVTGNKCEGFGGDISIMYLMNKVFDINGWRGNQFMKLSRDLQSYLDIVTNIGLCRENGAMTAEISTNAYYMLSNYRIAQYYWKNER